MSTVGPDDIVWRKSSYSANGSACVEVGWHGATTVAVRDSKHPGDPVLDFGLPQWRSLLARARE